MRDVYYSALFKVRGLIGNVNNEERIIDNILNYLEKDAVSGKEERNNEFREDLSNALKGYNGPFYDWFKNRERRVEGRGEIFLDIIGYRE
ncbi:MAG: hypothetical protein Q7S27_04650 [Nanoarchaeota archaeon]|nr:hypothetical protein [Nanoarchaeota archaeon]